MDDQGPLGQAFRIWHIRMRSGNDKQDFSQNGIDGGYIGINCKSEIDPGPCNLSQEDLKQIELDNKWSRNQITNFVELGEKDIILLSRKGSRFLSVGTIYKEKPAYFEESEVELRLRRSVKWINTKYAKDNLLGFGYFGLGTLIRKRKLDEYAKDIIDGQQIRIKQIQYSNATRSLARNEVEERFEALFPSYFEDLVRFVVEQEGLQGDYFVKNKLNDGGIDLRGWRRRNFFAKDLMKERGFVSRLSDAPLMKPI